MPDPAPTFDWFAALLQGPGARWLGVGLLALLGFGLGVILLARLPKSGRSAEGGYLRRFREGGLKRMLTGDESGVATMEFVLVFPIVMFLGMLLLQVTLAMVGNAVVNYAAFAATRAAIVQIPADHGDPAEPANTIRLSAGSEKFDRIQAAAVFAVVPVAGRLDSSEYPADDYRDGFDAMFSAQGRPSPVWVETMLAPRLNYAAQKTEITLLSADGSGEDVDFTTLNGSHTFGPYDAITVQVDHQLNLSVPYVRGIFSDGEHTTADGEGAYTDISTKYTLTNEGLPNELPPLPNLPRSP